MRKVTFVASLVLFSLPVIAAPEMTGTTASAPAMTEPAAASPAAPARLPCEDLKARVDAKLQAKGVPSYTLEIVSAEGAEAASGVAAAPASNAKQVGTCDGGTKRLMYTRGN